MEVLPEKVAREIQKIAKPLVNYLLFRDEASLGENTIRCDSSFQEVFRHERRHTQDGHSLKDLKLTGHLFENRCSYMIYSRAFTELPVPLKQAVFQQIRTILTAPEPVSGYEYLTGEEQMRISQILSETIPEFAS